MKDTDLVIHKPKKNNIFWQAYYRLYSKEKPKSDINIDIIDVKVLPPRGLALWKLMAASWVLRLGRCYEDEAVKASLFIFLLIAIIGGLLIGFGKFMDMDIHAQMPPLLSIVIHCLYRIIEFMMVGCLIIYGSWETVQGCKWLTEWSEKIKEKAQEEADKNEQRRNASSHD